MIAKDVIQPAIGQRARGCMGPNGRLDDKNRGLTLAGLEAFLRLVDDVDPALAAHNAIVAVP